MTHKSMHITFTVKPKNTAHKEQTYTYEAEMKGGESAYCVSRSPYAVSDDIYKKSRVETELLLYETALDSFEKIKNNLPSRFDISIKWTDTLSPSEETLNRSLTRKNQTANSLQSFLQDEVGRQKYKLRELLFPSEHKNAAQQSKKLMTDGKICMITGAALFIIVGLPLALSAGGVIGSIQGPLLICCCALVLAAFVIGITGAGLHIKGDNIKTHHISKLIWEDQLHQYYYDPEQVTPSPTNDS